MKTFFTFLKMRVNDFSPLPHLEIWHGPPLRIGLHAMRGLCDDGRLSKKKFHITAAGNDCIWLLNTPARAARKDTLFSFHRSFRPSPQAKQSWAPIRTCTLQVRPLWSKTPISGVCAKLYKGGYLHNTETVISV